MRSWFLLAQHSRDINEFLENLEQGIHNQKKAELLQLNEFRKTQVREDVLAPRVNLDDGKSHVAGCKEFIGNDLDAEGRTKKQKEQMKVWIQQQVWEKEQQKKAEKEHERYVYSFVNDYN